MRLLTYLAATSLDGRIAGPEDDFSAFPVEGDHVEMLVRDYPDTLPALAHEVLGVRPAGERFDTVLMGWRTYAAGLAVTTSPYPHLRQVVFSRRRGRDDVGPGVEVTAEHPVDVVRRLKREPGSGIWLCGGGTIAGVLGDEIDRLVVKVNPLLLGAGPALADGPYRPRGLTLTGTTTYASGVVVLEYSRA